ncbi:hypothetical protein GCM10007964_15570 [Sphaerisporangium melleum]|uniref:Uncharacterized protein n=1 Tax=Sphaerisporangium melleum TaxID=321316 RepID=A0A917VGM1_9ACTN|nr:hypothetical protein GCM10007964_15570 [Sphaerisporangium melleum]
MLFHPQRLGEKNIHRGGHRQAGMVHYKSSKLVENGFFKPDRSLSRCHGYILTCSQPEYLLFGHPTSRGAPIASAAGVLPFASPPLAGHSAGVVRTSMMWPSGSSK